MLLSVTGGDAGDCAGQAAFADFDLDGRLDVIFPACDDRDCRKGGNTIYFAPVIELIGGSRKDFLSVPIQLVEEWEFDGKKPEENEPYDGLVPRVGDINLDGYPDLMLRMRHRETGNTQMQVPTNWTRSYLRTGQCQILPSPGAPECPVRLFSTPVQARLFAAA